MWCSGSASSNGGNFNSSQNASALSRDRDATATSVQRSERMMARAFFFAIEAQPMMPMRTVYGEASIIASAAIDASRAAILFEDVFGSLVAQHAQRVQLSASGRQKAAAF